MKYFDSVEKSAEYLRLALPLMTKQSAALHPVSYAVWYGYVSGRNSALKISIDEHLQNGAVLDEAATYDMFYKHVAGINEQVAQRVSEVFQKVMEDISSSSAQAGDQAGQFGSALEQWCDDLRSSNSGASLGADAILGLTRNMQDAIVTLNRRLDESRREIRQLQQEVIKAREDSLVDGLTGLTNRRGFDIAIAACLLESDATESGTSLLIIDIDHFKWVNDTYGHMVGDKVIRAVAQILKDNVKGKDTAARYGGEEFVILLPDTPIEGARQVAEKIRTKIEECRIKRTTDSKAVANITVSLGVASYKGEELIADFVARADAALYGSKNEGRNRVTLAR